MKKRNVGLTFLAVASAVLLCGCGGYESMENAQFGEIRQNFNETLDLSGSSVTADTVPQDFELIVEAEDGSFTGNAAPFSDSGFSGGQGVDGVNQSGDSLTFIVDISSPGIYNLTFTVSTPDSGRCDNAFVDGESVGTIIASGKGEAEDVVIENVYLEAGERKISVEPNWGWIKYDRLKLTAAKSISDDIYNVTAGLSNPNADDRTKSLYKFLKDIYGKYTLSGQVGDKGRESPEYQAIKDVTGKEFAVLGLDLFDYDATAAENGIEPTAIERAYDWYINAGGIVELHWHWHSPKGYIPDGANWYSSFYKESSTINLDKAMNGEDEVLYNLLIEDIDRISEQLARLRDCGVPVLFRPLHEASGGWFWWGNCQSESYIKLYRLIYDRMTNTHGLTNIIWVWNGQSEEWYPGDDVVDIASWDIYAGEHQYSSQSATFARCSGCTGVRKLIALSENGCIPDPDLLKRDNSRWLYWCVWSGDFCVRWGEAVYNDQYTEREMLKKAYDSDYTLTLDELPDLKNYPFD